MAPDSIERIIYQRSRLGADLVRADADIEYAVRRARELLDGNALLDQGTASGILSSLLVRSRNGSVAASPGTAPGRVVKLILSENTEDGALLFKDERHSGARPVDKKSSKSGTRRG